MPEDRGTGSSGDRGIVEGRSSLHPPIPGSPDPPITRAFVFAAGLGTRLRPYTLHTPKPMLDVAGRPLVEHLLCGLARAGVRHATLNTAYLADAFEALPARARAYGLDVALSRQPAPLEHGGDLAYAQPFWDRLGPDETFLALNGDTLYDLDAAALADAAGGLSAQAPLMILTFGSAANPLVVGGGRLLGIRDLRYAEGPEDGRADDVGLKLVHASVRQYLPPPGEVLSFHGEHGLVGRIASAGKAIFVRPAPVRARIEIGTVADYEGREANAELQALVGRLCP